MASAPGNAGARLVDEARAKTAPNQPLVIVGGPEAVVYAPPGWVVADELGNLWLKKTDASLATGWDEVTAT